MNFNEHAENVGQDLARGERLAALFAYRRIIEYVNDIRAASYPQTPSQTGGLPYDYFAGVLDQLAAFQEGEKVEIFQCVIAAVRDFVKSDAAGLNGEEQSNLQYARAIEHFEGVLQVIEQLLDGSHPVLNKATDISVHEDAPVQAL